MNWVDPDGRELIAAFIGAGIGTVSGITGALAQGGSLSDILISGAVGAAAGTVTGLLDPTMGVATVMIVTGGVGAFANLAGQVITNVSQGQDIGCINMWSVIGSGIGSAIGGGMGNIIQKGLLSVGASTGISGLGGLMGVGPSALGGATGTALGQ